MTTIHEGLDAILGPHISPIMLASMKRRALSSLGLERAELAPQHLPALRHQLEAGIRLFVSFEAQAQVLADLDAFTAEHAPAADPVVVPIRTEADVSLARSRARTLAQRLGGGEFAIQRAATAASELARNILSYAGEGHVELCPRPESDTLALRAEDSGPGIADLESVLAGRYRSRTGLGLGLRGVKRLARHFHVLTGPTGTRVEADISIRG
jgi:serine/threonine-protein kinase RsbT